MSRGPKMKKTKRVKHKVQCAINPEHVFEKVYDIEEGSESLKSEMQVYCPYCDEFVDVTIQGKVVPDDSILRSFGIQSGENSS
jgi:hypothetical protein